MKRRAWVCGVLLSAGLLSGCVERRYVITSDPPGALVLRNGERIGATPADDHFVYYGTYHFTLIRDGYETLQVDQPINAPWYEYAPLDFFSEVLTPWKIRDVRHFEYKLQPIQVPNVDEVIQRGQQLRERGQAIEPPPPSPGQVPLNPKQPPPGSPPPGTVPATPPVSTPPELPAAHLPPG